jgi:uncharacterized protein YggE
MRRTVLLLSLLVLTVPATLLAQQTPLPAPPPAIVVSGHAQLEADPDSATVRLGVIRQASSAQAAQEQANVAAKEILAAIGKLGVPAQKIQTSRLTLRPNYRGEPPRIASYSASNIISIELDDLSRVGPVIDAGFTAGANELDGVRFRLKNDTAVRERALRDAVIEARRKAEVIAEALGVRLAGVLEVSESGVAITERSAGPEFGVLAARAADTPVSPGQLDVNANVTVRYRIAEAGRN